MTHRSSRQVSNMISTALKDELNRTSKELVTVSKQLKDERAT